MTNKELQEFLEENHSKFNRTEFIADDPISIPHQYSKKQDIEIAGLFAAIFSWGQRGTIINKSNEFLNIMDNDPFRFITNHSDSDLTPFNQFKHRTFQPTDALYLIDFLSRYFKSNNSLEGLFISKKGMESGLKNFHDEIFKIDYAPDRTRKHIPTPERNSTCKRLNMFLRWMVRKDANGVDFGIWNKINSSDLICPIDIHVGNISRQLGLLKRSQNDWKAAVELTTRLRQFDPNDPVKYDFALFGIGVVGGLEIVGHRF